ncbi:hypothetical protein JL720_12377 [Aureococcus anophagefferens]|nr:hypothetical protein JL720_12377 [Aureococcus anophagefferens]
MSNYKCPSDHSVPALDAEGFAPSAPRRLSTRIPAIGDCFSDGQGTVEDPEDCCAGHFRYSTFYVDVDRTVASAAKTNEAVVDAADPRNAGADNLVFHHLRFEHCDEDFSGLFAGNFDRTRQPGDTLESIEAAAGKPADAPGVAGASMTGEIPIEGGLSRNDASVYVAALSGGLEAVQEAKKDLRTRSGAVEKQAPASKQRVKDGSQVLELKVQETSGDALCYPDGATLFPALLQAKAGFHTGGKPWGGMLLTDRGQYGGLHSNHLDPTFTYDHLAALRPAVDGYDEMRDACGGGDRAYHFKKTCTYEDAAMRGKDLAYSGVFSCSEACVVDRFYAIDDPDLDLGPDERRSCAQPVLATLFNTPDLFKSCLTPDYDYTRGGAASGADGCHECIDACVDAYPGASRLRGLGRGLPGVAGRLRRARPRAPPSMMTPPPYSESASALVDYFAKHRYRTMPTIEPCGVSFDKVAYELRCKYAGDESGGPANSASLKAAEALLQEYLPALKALPGAEVTRVMCGGCHDFKIVVNQPCADHDAWKAADYAPAPDPREAQGHRGHLLRRDAGVHLPAALGAERRERRGAPRARSSRRARAPRPARPRPTD